MQISRYIGLNQDIPNSGSFQAMKYYRFVLRYFFYFSSFSTSASCNTFKMGLKNLVNEIQQYVWVETKWVLPLIAHVMSSYDSYCSIQLMHLKHGWTLDPVFGFQPNSTEPSSSKAKWWKRRHKALQILIPCGAFGNQRSKLLKLLAKRCSLKQI